MKFSQILGRLTGIDVWVFGVSWNPPESERSIARRVLASLEDRRVLYAPYHFEVLEDCVDSVFEVRSLLTEELTKLDPDRELAHSLSAMRAACRKFLSLMYPRDEPTFRWRTSFGDEGFYSALGEMRGVFGVHIAKIAASYGLDVEDDLATILPAAEENDEEESDVSEWQERRKLRFRRT